MVEGAEEKEKEEGGGGEGEEGVPRSRVVFPLPGTVTTVSPPFDLPPRASAKRNGVETN